MRRDSSVGKKRSTKEKYKREAHWNKKKINEV